MRGPIAPSGVPLNRTRSASFDALVLEAVEHIERRWSAQLEHVQFAVEDVPPLAVLGRDTADPVPLGVFVSATAATPAQVVIYRRPIEARSTGLDELAELVAAVVIEKVAEYLGVEPNEVDPDYNEWENGPDGE
jgi:predicted Zn-dependent protease with MMP-like domain